MVVTTLELCKVYIKLDQPNTAIDTYVKATYVWRPCVRVTCAVANAASHVSLRWRFGL